ncbi:MAG: hypothetical protein ACOZBZ_04295 [Patescibacteria group bacterium]
MSKQKLKFLICLLVIILFVGIFGYLLEAWTGFPKGADAYARITRIVYILDFFPNVFWQYHWANGMPTFTSEAPLFYFLGAIMAKIFSLTPEQPLYIIGFLTFVMIGIGVFGYVLTLTKSFIAGLLSAILALSSFSLWSWMVAGGIYPRIFAVGFSMLTLWLLVRFLEAVRNSQVFPRGKFIWLVLCLAATMTAHALMGFFTWLAIFLILLSHPLSLKLKMKYGFLIYLVSFSLASFFLLPAVFSFSGGGGRFIGVISPVIPALGYYLYEFSGMGPFVLSLLVVSFLAVFFLARSPEGEEFSLFLMFVFFSAYALIGYTGFPSRYYYINGFIPLSATLFMTLYGSLLIGLLFARLEKVFKRIVPALGVMLVILVIASSILVGVPLIKNDSRTININNTSKDTPGNDTYALWRILKFPQKEDFNHRFAAYDAAEAVWFNTFYKIPQVRDYYGQGILYPDWRYWFEQAVWNQKEFSLEEAKAAFDWFAVRWFSTYETHFGLPIFEKYQNEEMARRLEGITVDEFLSQSPNRYLHEPGFKFISHGRIHYDGVQEEFEIENPSPILSASNVPTVLFIGDPKNYNLLFSNLTFGNYSSQKIIPLRGKKYLDDYELSELRQYNTLLLYTYQYHDPKKAAKILVDYLKQGGNLIWENWESPEIPELSPFSLLEKSQVEGGIWNLSVNPDSKTPGVDFNSFSPPLYNNTPWKITTGKTDTLKPWAKVLLSSGDKPLLVSGDFAKGKIIWSGFNFFYHLNAYKNLEEAKLFYQILEEVAWVSKENNISFKANFINPQKREIKIEGEAKGVLFKESYHPNWHAYEIGQDGQRKNLKIELAGPGMMYAFLGEGGAYPIRVFFEYRFSLIEKLGFLLSLLTVVVLLFYGLKLGLVEMAILRLRKKSMPTLKKTKGWWNDEET